MPAMFYEPDKDNHGLRFNPYKSIVVPRPIGWISTISRDGVVNLAPYSQFNNLGYDPPYVMFSGNSFPGTGRRKDTIRNATDTGEFVVNMATYELREAINVTSQFVPPEIDEAALAGVEMIPCRIVRAPRVAASPIHLECKFHSSLVLPGNTFDHVHHVVIGRVVGVHIRDDVLTSEGKVDVIKIRPLARLGYFDYTTVDSLFTMPPCGPNLTAREAGLEGRPDSAVKVT
jgi:flavin reductase (DIM6/NTAB) family NADH-FMN oxidoreductase RutF